MGLFAKNKGIEDFSSIYGRIGKRLYFSALRITGNDADAQEAVQESFVSFYGKLKDAPYRIKNPDAYLTAACIRKSIDIIKKKSRNRAFLDELKEDEECVAEEFDTGQLQTEENELVRKIREGIMKMEEKYRIIVSLRAVEEYSYREIAEITGLKENTVRIRYMRGKEKLINYLKD